MVGVDGVGLTVIVIALDVAGLPVTPAKFEVITHVITCPLVNVEVVYVELFEPTFEPFTFHWYIGVVPPFVGVAVKVTELPEHVGFVPLVFTIETAANKAAGAVMFMSSI